MENMPPGYRFYPTEEELISFYLHNKLQGDREDMNRVIPVLDIYDYNPWELPNVSGEASLRDTEQWFFFIPRQESEARGGKPKRLTTTGYWKATGSPNHVYSSDNGIIGMKRTMVFYNGRAPNGTKTEWKMNEYKAIKGQPSSSRSIPTLRHEYSLCRLYKKTKCLRAFDRRPPPRRDHIGSHPTDVKKAEDKEASASALASASTSASTSYHQHNPPHMAERGTATSPESSSSGEHGHPSHIQMELDDEPLLDWKQVDWFLGNWDIEDDSKA